MKKSLKVKLEIKDDGVKKELEGYGAFGVIIDEENARGFMVAKCSGIDMLCAYLELKKIVKKMEESEAIQIYLADKKEATS